MSDNEHWYVFAKTYLQFRLFCRQRGKNPSECSYIDSSEKLRGIRHESVLIFLPEFRENRVLWNGETNRILDHISRFDNKFYAEIDPEIPFVPCEVS
jgi:hypothetical protein